ncbi:MAG: hypothetical protein AAF570_27285, partial [Bacteroidota bacterium]
LSLTFDTAHFAACKEWVARILQLPRTPVRADIVQVARIFSILLDFEKGDFQAMDYNIARVSRFLDRRGKWLAFEKQLVQHLRRVMDARPEDLKACWTDFAKFLQQKEFEGLLGVTELQHYVARKLA